MSLAAHVDLEVANARPHIADSQEYLPVHRYDRGGDAADKRIHREGFWGQRGEALLPAAEDRP